MKMTDLIMAGGLALVAWIATRSGGVPTAQAVATNVTGWTETYEHLIETYGPAVQAGDLEVRGSSLTGLPLFAPVVEPVADLGFSSGGAEAILMNVGGQPEIQIGSFHLGENLTRLNMPFINEISSCLASGRGWDWNTQRCI